MAGTPGQAWEAWYSADSSGRSMAEDFSESKRDAMRRAFLAGTEAPNAPKPAPEIRTCYCGKTGPDGADFPHDDCDGSVLADPWERSTKLALTIAAALTDLDGYIERRAAELAAPKIAEAEARADRLASEVNAGELRRADLIEEFRRRIAPLERGWENCRALLEEATTALAAAGGGDRAASNRTRGGLKPTYPATEQQEGTQS